jgi:putative Holliday junction resolvase
MKLLGVDYGEKRLGLAFSDTILHIVLPYGVIEKRKSLTQAEALAEIVNKGAVERVVFGFPLSTSGRENRNTQRVQELAFELGKLVTATIDFFDERFTSQAGDARGGGASRDEKAAMIILEDYITKNKL